MTERQMAYGRRATDARVTKFQRHTCIRARHEPNDPTREQDEKDFFFFLSHHGSLSFVQASASHEPLAHLAVRWHPSGGCSLDWAVFQLLLAPSTPPGCKFTRRFGGQCLHPPGKPLSFGPGTGRQRREGREIDAGLPPTIFDPPTCSRRFWLQ